jgi:hypothetical protein
MPYKLTGSWVILCQGRRVWLHRFLQADGLAGSFLPGHFLFRGTLQSSYRHSLAWCRSHLILGHYQAGRLRLHRDTSSAARCSIWRPRYTDTSHAHSMSSPKMNSLQILLTNTQLLSGRRSSVSVRKTSFKMGRAVFQAIHWWYLVLPQLHTPWYPRSSGMVYHRPTHVWPG